MSDSCSIDFRELQQAGGIKASDFKDDFQPGKAKSCGILFVTNGYPENIETIKTDFDSFYNNRYTKAPVLTFNGLLSRLEIKQKISQLEESFSKALTENRNDSIKKFSHEIKDHLKENFPDQDFPILFFQSRFSKNLNEIINQIQSKNIDSIFVVPLFPHYSKWASEFAFEELKTELKDKLGRNLKILPPFCHDFEFQQSIVEEVQKKLTQTNSTHATALCFWSRNSRTFKKDFDPYLEQTKKSAKEIFDIVNESNSSELISHNIFYGGEGQRGWLNPNPTSVLNELTDNGIQNVISIPFSTLDDDLELNHHLHNQFDSNLKKNDIKNHFIIDSLMSSQKASSTLSRLISQSLIRWERNGN